MEPLRLALIQPAVSGNPADGPINVSRAIAFVDQAKQQGADIVILPEAWSLTLDIPYGTAQFANYCEPVPTGKICRALSAAAKRNGIWLIGGTVNEQEGDKFYNACTVWNPEGEFVTKYRKLHMYDVHMKEKPTFIESSSVTAGDGLTTFVVKGWRIGLGICYDIRFEEIARLYRDFGCQLMVYCTAFNVTTGPKHWTLLQRIRAVDNQLYVAALAPAQSEPHPGYVAYGHSQLTDPWGKTVKNLGPDEGMFLAEIDPAVVEKARSQIPIFDQRRTDLYETISKTNAHKLQ